MCTEKEYLTGVHHEHDRLSVVSSQQKYKEKHSKHL